jgi:hypothetical protein
MKKVLLVLLSFGVFFGCKNTTTNNQSIASDTEQVVTISVDEFLANPAAMVDKQVIITGMVSHVCKHGGQKMFLVSTNPDKYLRINTSEAITEFPIDLEGGTVEIKGVVAEFETAAPEEAGKDVEEHHEGDSALQEKAYHKDNFFVIVAESYTVKE